MIGVRSGIKTGPRPGLAVGLSGDELTASSVLFADATSGKSCPASAAEWTALGLATPNPTSLFLLQDASGNPAAALGTMGLSVSGFGGPNYQQNVAGWSRKAITLNEGGQAKLTATISNSNASDFLALLYARLTATPGGTRQILEHPTIYAEATSAPRFLANAGTPVTGTVDPGTTVHAIVVKNWIGNSRGLFTEAEALQPNEFVAAGTTLNIGGATNAPMGVLYLAVWQGVAARFSNAQIKTMLQTLGWSVAW